MPVAVRPLLNSKDKPVSQLIPEEVVQEVLLRTDIVDVIGDYVQLKRTGANAKGLCPFHQEKTPSFTVSPAKGLFLLLWLPRQRQCLPFSDAARAHDLSRGRALPGSALWSAPAGSECTAAATGELEPAVCSASGRRDILS
jgi:hypothetical protein